MKTVIDKIPTTVQKLNDTELKGAVRNLRSGVQASQVADIANAFHSEYPEALFPEEACRQAIYREAAFRWASIQDE